MAVDRVIETVSLVVPVYNEREVIPTLVTRLQKLLDELKVAGEVWFIDDGSRDGSGELLAAAAAADPRLKYVGLSRNFGHQVAITAGTDLAGGDVVVVMDADLQDPPELVPRMIEQYRAGFDVVYARRVKRHGETWFKRVTAAAFYRLMRLMIHPDLPENVGDFRLMGRPVVEALAELREQHRFVRGMVTWLGFRQTALEFERPPREFGETKYPLRKMVAFAWRAVTSFSGLPLRLAAGVGVAMMVGAAGYALVAGYQAVVLQITVPGWASVICFQAMLSGITLLVLGLMGDYIARIYDELKQRPLYVIREFRNVTPDELRGRRRRVLP